MAAVHAPLLSTLADLWKRRASASVTVHSGRVHRVLHVQRGELIGADSDVLTERLGVLLVADGKLDAALVEPLVNAARASGRYFGDQIVAEGLLTGAEIAARLQVQALARFDRALQMQGGEVTVGPLKPVRTVLRCPLAAVIVSAFRERLPVDAAASLVASVPATQSRMHPDLYTPQELGLVGNELRYWRQLASGQDACAVLDRAQEYEVALRLIGALVGLGAIGGQARVDPIAAMLRSA